MEADLSGALREEGAGAGRELGRRRKKRLTRGLMGAREGFLGGNELPLRRKKQVESMVGLL